MDIHNQVEFMRIIVWSWNGNSSVVIIIYNVQNIPPDWWNETKNPHDKWIE